MMGKLNTWQIAMEFELPCVNTMTGYHFLIMRYAIGYQTRTNNSCGESPAIEHLMITH